MGRRERITEAVKTHDPMLFCKEHTGKLCIFRKGWKWESYDIDDEVLLFLRPDDYFVMALTDTWKLAGSPVDHGLDPILRRIQAIDLWKVDMATESIKSAEKHEESQARDRRNKNEAFLYDFRSRFAKTFNDVNVANMDKQKTKIKGVKNGNY